MDKKKPGRPTMYGTRMVRREVSLTEAAWEMLQERYGGDSYSMTIRSALLRLIDLEDKQRLLELENREKVTP